MDILGKKKKKVTLNIQKILIVSLILGVLGLLGLKLWSALEVTKQMESTIGPLTELVYLFEAKIGGYQGQHKSIESQLASLNEVYEASRDENEKSKKEKAVLLTRIDGYREYTTELMGSIEDIKADLLQAMKTVSEKDMEIEDFKEKVRVYKIENADLKEKVLKAQVQTISKDNGAVTLEPVVVKSKSERFKGGRIREINKEYNFVLLDIGHNQGIEEGDVLFVFRGRKLLGKIIVEKVGENASIAKGFFRSVIRTIRKGDTVKY